MFKKLKICLLALLFFLNMSAVFARAALGAAFSYSVSNYPHGAVSFSARSDTSPWSVFFNSHLGENTVTLFLDDWFINERLCEHADYFVLWGMSYGATFEEDEIIFAMGSRFGAGLDFFLLSRRLEIFGQTVWNPYFGFKKKDGDYSPLFRPVNFPCSAGLRLWF